MEHAPESALASALRLLLRPLVRLVLRRGMAFGEFSELVKRVYVDVASRELALPDRRPTISRIAVVTGLTRKEASRLIGGVDGQPSDGPERRRVNRAARVLSGWVGDPDFRDGRGAPASLPFDAESDRSFSELVRRHGADVPPRAVLDELIRVGAVRSLKNERYRPVERAYVPAAADEEKLAILGTDVADLVAAIEHNLLEPSGEPFYQRKVAYDNLPADFLPKLRARVRVDAQALLESLDREMAAEDRDLNPGAGEGGARAMIGIYYYEEKADETD